MAAPITGEALNSLIELQTIQGKRINANYENFGKTPMDKRTRPFIKNRLKECQSNWEKFDEDHRVIFMSMAASERKTNAYLSSSFYDEVREIKNKFEVKAETWLEEIELQRTTAATTSNAMFSDTLNRNLAQLSASSNALKLPPIDIEPFAGDYHKWPAFKSLFTNLIHNKADISPVEKLHHLLHRLKGEPKRIISHYSLTSDNYVVAWDAIKNRYDNKRILVNTELKLLMNQTTITAESANQLKSLLDQTNECLNALKNLEIDISTWDPILVYILVQKIDPKSRTHWETSLVDPRAVPTLNSFLEFLETRFRCLESIDCESSGNKQSSNRFTLNNQNAHNNNYQQSKYNNIQQSKVNNSQYNSRQNSNVYNQSNRSYNQNSSENRSSNFKTSHHSQFQNNRSSFVAEVEHVCPICQNDHNIFNCKDFTSKTVAQRKATVSSLDLCTNCLGKHSTDTCSSARRCKECKHRHHTLLHNTQASSSANPFSLNSNSSRQTTSSHFAEESSVASQVLLATAVIPVLAENGEQHLLRCLLDQGSQSSFITESASQLLRLRKTPIVVTITGIASTKSETSKHLVTVNIKSRYDKNFETPVEALVLSKITGHLPSSFISTKNDWEHLSGLFLADPQYGRPNKIDMLLGADIYSKILINGLKKGPLGSPIAQQTKLGWIISGQVWNDQNHDSNRRVQSFHLRTDIDKALTKFWEIEELPSIRTCTQDETECERIFAETHRRDESGRFVVALPFKQDRSQLGKSKYRAMQRFTQLLSKFDKNHSYRTQYTAVIDEYLSLNHMKKSSSCTSSSNDCETYYLPHHAVIKESSTTTKMRVVFDASAKTTSGQSLNDQLLVGPTIQQDLASILLRWRTHKIVLSADITKMYRQIWIREEDRRYHKVLWQNNGYIDEFELQTVTFGTAPAAYLAIKSLQQLAQYESNTFPKAAEVTTRDFYVDDLLTGADTTKEAIRLQNDLSNLLSAGGFELRKWISNDDEVIRQIPAEHREIAFPLSFEEDNTTKTLGMHYHPAIDAFQFKVRILNSEPPTKRTLLADTARLFDPLGWLAPVVVKAKIFLQRVWQAGYDWDHKLTGSIRDEWLQYKSELIFLEDIRIQRWFAKEKQNNTIQLHGFCDASESAYAAVVYIRITNIENESHVTMVSAKTKVAPLQTISLPRLELCGAGLLAKLLTFIKNALMLEIDDVFAWTDSEIVLAWLRGNPSRWKTFVANRVTKIMEHTSINQWHHVASEQNPADCASRGIYPAELKDHLLWWSGPVWLKNFDAKSSVHREFDTSLESKTKTIVVQHINISSSWLNNYSSLSKLLRVTAKVLRFFFNCRNPSNKRVGMLTAIEYSEAMNVCVKIVQQSEFHSDIQKIKLNGQCQAKSKLLPFNPFVDKNGLLRIGGRLKNADLSFDQKYQIIIPDTHFANLVIKDAHIRSEHGGTQITMSTVRNKFWIINGRNTIKKFIYNCIICHRHRKASNEQLMGSLPKSRLQADRAFLRVGIDYCGPYDIKASRLRGTRISKGYISLFVCLSTKAVHIEVVSELSTAAFLAAFNRFVGRRGLPSDIYSDNGTNFVGADRLIKRLIKTSTDQNQVISKAAEKGIKWHFIPPRSPHFGGLWESAIKSMKKHLVRIIGSTALTFEELSTVVVKVEAVLNSRPLIPFSDDPNDFSPLTPGHFLIGCELLAPPTEDLSNHNPNALNKWRLINKIHQDFWKRWKNEYLNTLQRRYKWTKKNQESKVGDLILLKEDNVPPNNWPLARIVNVFPGEDGHVRVVTVKTPSGSLFKRSITKIHPLPIDSDDKDDTPPNPK